MARHQGTRWRKRKTWRNRKSWNKFQRRQAKFKPRQAREIVVTPRLRRSIPPAQASDVETRHHCIPSSRGGPDSPANIRWKPSKIHVAWHILFANMTPEEIIRLIKANSLEGILRLNGSGRHYENRKWAWNMIFTQYEARSRSACIRIVERDWTPPGLNS